MYFLLCGGDKSTQGKDIATVKKLAAERDAELAAMNKAATTPAKAVKAKRKKPKSK